MPARRHRLPSRLFRRLLGVPLCVLLLAGCGGSAQPKQAAPAAPHGKRYLGSQVPPGSRGADFALRDQNGRLVRLTAQRGKLVFVTFLYTHCTDICPLIADHLNTVVRDLGHHQNDVRVLAVSVDPKGDTRSAVRAYVRMHRLLPQFHYLVGTRAQLKPVWQGYNVVAEPGTSPDRVAHTASIFLIDRHGRPRLFFTPETGAKTMSHDLLVLLRAGA